MQFGNHTVNRYLVAATYFTFLNRSIISTTQRIIGPGNSALSDLRVIVRRDNTGQPNTPSYVQTIRDLAELFAEIASTAYQSDTYPNPSIIEIRAIAENLTAYADSLTIDRS